jgi:hypothetical protein
MKNKLIELAKAMHELRVYNFNTMKKDDRFYTAANYALSQF